jgi:hypothetical protein
VTATIQLRLDRHATVVRTSEDSAGDDSREKAHSSAGRHPSTREGSAAKVEDLAERTLEVVAIVDEGRPRHAASRSCA